ncbi:MAG: alkaline phosphatase [Burkholderiales bacterium]|nr:MAG: alkaline phosphatase [Burkholderiales bacterium]
MLARRQLLERAALATAAAQTLWLPRSAWSQARLSSNPFTLGIASGSPTSDGIVLWTRLAPSGFLGSSSLGNDNITVRWEIAHDERFTRIVQSGQAQATAQLAHSVHVEVAGLEGGRGYFYRFMVGDWTSTTGRTRTLPAMDAPAGKFRIAYASCQRWEHGYYSAYRHMLADQPDLVLFLGDYVYEYPNAANAVRKPNATSNGGWVISLDDYRSRYALHKSDPDLQAMHAACPWAFTWDDHEVQNDYAGLSAGDAGPAVSDFAARRAAAYQAFYEHTPLRASTLTRSLAGLLERPAAELRIYGQLKLGALGNLYLLDPRQYKDAPVCTKEGEGKTGSVNPAQCPAWNDPTRSFLGAAQEQWIAQALVQNANAGGWQIIGQSTRFGLRDSRASGAGQTFGNDNWDGYSAARTRLTDAMQKSGSKNNVMLGGDVHENWVGHIKSDYAKASSASIGTEFCGTSITSRNGATSTNDKIPDRLARNPHFTFADAEKRGYGLADFSKDKLQVSLRTVSDVTSKDASIQTLAQFSVAFGKPDVERI